MLSAHKRFNKSIGFFFRLLKHFEQTFDFFLMIRFISSLQFCYGFDDCATTSCHANWLNSMHMRLHARQSMISIDTIYYLCCCFSVLFDQSVQHINAFCSNVTTKCNDWIWTLIYFVCKALGDTRNHLAFCFFLFLWIHRLRGAIILFFSLINCVVVKDKATMFVSSWHCRLYLIKMH